MRSEKLQLSNDIQSLLSSPTGVFLVKYKGLKVADFSELRKSLISVGAECHVVPNRILRRAASELGVRELADLQLTGDTALVTGGSDAARVAKAVKGFAKDKQALGFKGGVLNRRLISASEASDLAELPPREILLAQLLGLFAAPPRHLVTVLNAKAASILYVLRSYMEKQEKTA
jgi:large subunit ribosomal protein L10